jgi:AcrR family transcriptional regulator
LSKSDTSQQWIEAGYSLFAQEGPDGVLVEKLARQLGRNKSGFYYHFGDRDIFFSELIQHHHKIMDQFYRESSKCRHFDPDYLSLLLEYQTATYVQLQLRRHIDIPLFNDAFIKIKTKTEKGVRSLWADFIKIPQNHPLVPDLWNIMRDLFYMRLTGATPDLKSLQELVKGFSVVVEKLKRLAQMQDSIPVIPFRTSADSKQNTRLLP